MAPAKGKVGAARLRTDVNEKVRIRAVIDSNWDFPAR